MLFLGIPVWVGRKLHTRYKGASKHKRNCAVMGGVAASVSSQKYNNSLTLPFGMQRTISLLTFWLSKGISQGLLS